MGLLDRLRGRDKRSVFAGPAPVLDVPAPPTGRIRLEEHAYSFVADDGEEIISRGFRLVRPGYDDADDDGEIISYEDEELLAGGVRVFHVAGVTFRGDDPWGPAFNPGLPVVFQREPENAYDKNAVKVLDASRRRFAGYVPARLAPEIAAALDAGFERHGVVLCEFVKAGRRCGLVVLAGPIQIAPEKPRR